MLRQRAKGNADEEWPPPPPPLTEDKPQLCSSKIHRLSTTGTVLAVVTVAGLMYVITVLLNNKLPVALNIADESFHPRRFIAERARNTLEQLADLGPKVTGSYENEVSSIDLLSIQINYTMRQANHIHKITYDLQKTSGSYYLDFKPVGLASYYSNVQNIVVKIGPHSNATSSLLINCHFDSVPASPGASDDGLNCAVMLEVLRILSKQETPLKQNVIFLFNGAEETPLQASHGFITQHKWASEIRAFINLESCGAGGREILFQAGPNHPWLIKLYGEAAPYPHANVLAEDIFQGGLVPSDTDFRIFRDYGHIPGIDFAHSKNGYVYHTKYDRLDQIMSGVFQHTGDNLLALVRHIIASDEIKQPNLYKEGREVYFDLGGLILIHYSETLGIIINLAAVMLSFYTVLQNTFLHTAGMKRKEACQHLAMSVLIPGLGFVLAVAVSVLVGFILDTAQSSLSWYTHSSLILPLYYLPTILALGAPLYLFNISNSLCTGVKVQMYCNGIQLLWSIFLFLATMSGIRSAYILMVVVLIPAMANFLLLLLQLQRSVPVWLSGYMASALLPAFYIVYISLLAMQLFIPVAGRLGSNTNPELLVGTLSALLCTLTASYFIPLIVLVRKPWAVFTGLAVINIATIIAVIYTSIGFPYMTDGSSPTTQRLLVIHTERNFYEVSGELRRHDSGYFVITLDRRTNEVGKVVPEVGKAKDVVHDCETEFLCGIPVISSRLKPSSGMAKWIASAAPVIHERTFIELTSTKSLSANVKRFTFSVIGPDQMVVVLWPKRGISLTGWSFAAGIPKTVNLWQDRPYYIIKYTRGLAGTAWELWFDLKIPAENAAGPTVDVAVVGHYLHDDRTTAFKQFLTRFPSWAHITSWTATFKIQTF